MTIKCVSCGKFIPYSDLNELEDGSRAKLYYEPLNEYGPEILEWTCAKCAADAPEIDTVHDVKWG